jgi:hypothetical protein
MPAEKIQLEPVESSNLAAIGYNPQKKIVAVKFKSGSIYHHAGFPMEAALAFYQADSRGRYYSQNIKGKFPGQRMTGPCPACGAEGWIGDVCEACGDAHHQEKERSDARREAN